MQKQTCSYGLMRISQQGERRESRGLSMSFPSVWCARCLLEATCKLMTLSFVLSYSMEIPPDASRSQSMPGRIERQGILSSSVSPTSHRRSYPEDSVLCRMKSPDPLHFIPHLDCAVALTLSRDCNSARHPLSVNAGLQTGILTNSVLFTRIPAHFFVVWTGSRRRRTCKIELS